MHQLGLEGYGYPGNLDLWGSLSWVSLNKTKLAAVVWESRRLGVSRYAGHAFVCSQRLETLQQNCQETCALLQGVIDSVRALQQPVESGVSFTPSQSPRMFP